MSLAKGGVWGAYTNGAALYDRARLERVGRLYGEPRDELEAFEGCHLCSEVRAPAQLGATRAEPNPSLFWQSVRVRPFFSDESF